MFSCSLLLILLMFSVMSFLQSVLKVKRLKVATFIYRHLQLQGNPDQQRFTMRSGVLTDNDSRWRSASSGSPLPERTDFGPRSQQSDRPNYAPASRTMAFTPQCSPAVTRRSRVRVPPGPRASYLHSWCSDQLSLPSLRGR